MLVKASAAVVLLASSVLGAGPNLDQVFAAQDSAVSAAQATSSSASVAVSSAHSSAAKSSHKASTTTAKHHLSSSTAHKSSTSKSKSATRSSIALSHSSSAKAASKSASKSKAVASAASETETESSVKASSIKAHSSAASHASASAKSVKSSSAKSTKSTKSTSTKLTHSSKTSAHKSAASSASASELDSAATATDSASASAPPKARLAFAHHHGRGMERKLRSSRYKERDAAIAALPEADDEVRKREVAMMKRMAEHHGLRSAPDASRLRRRDADADDIGQAAELVARSASVAVTASPAVASAAVAKAIQSGYFHGASSYYLFAMSATQRYAVLDALQDGGFSVVRIFIASVGANNKGSDSQAVNDVEPDEVGTYDDSILTLVDQLMYDCSQRGLKLLITLGDRYALGWWSTDAYATQLGIAKAGSSGVQQITDASKFYQSSWAASAWDNRMAHILAHKNALLGNVPWSQLSEVVYAFEPQNEPQGHMNLVAPSWVCNRAQKLQSLLSAASSSILVSSGGGITTTTSLDSSFTSCDALDVISVHDYGTDASTTVNALVAAQKSVGDDKLVIMGEWGATGTNKATIVKNFVTGFKAAGIPQMVWQVTVPGKGAADFEISPSGDAIDKAAWAALTGGYLASSTTSAKASSSTAQWHSSSASWSAHASSSSSAAKAVNSNN